MKKYILALAIAALPFHAIAEDATSNAKPWNLSGEQKARFSAKVVDILCEVSGKCADQCGAGSYQLGLLTTDGKIIPVNKNGQSSFNGAIVDLLPYCGKTVEVDGLLVGEDVPAQLYQVQLIKTEGADWAKADLHTKEWESNFRTLVEKGHGSAAILGFYPSLKKTDIWVSAPKWTRPLSRKIIEPCHPSNGDNA